jgi:hypothetical protein
MWYLDVNSLYRTMTFPKSSAPICSCILQWPYRDGVARFLTSVFFHGLASLGLLASFISFFWKFGHSRKFLHWPLVSILSCEYRSWPTFGIIRDQEKMFNEKSVGLFLRDAVSLNLWFETYKHLQKATSELDNPFRKMHILRMNILEDFSFYPVSISASMNGAVLNLCICKYELWMHQIYEYMNACKKYIHKKLQMSPNNLSPFWYDL